MNDLTILQEVGKELLKNYINYMQNALKEAISAYKEKTNNNQLIVSDPVQTKIIVDGLWYDASVYKFYFEREGVGVEANTKYGAVQAILSETKISYSLLLDQIIKVLNETTTN